MAELYWGDKRVIGIKPPGGEYVDLCTYDIIGLDVTIPNETTSLAGSSFYQCTGLVSITIPSSVTSIGGSCFYGCTGLTSITIPSSVTSLGTSCFRGCASLTKIYFAGNPPTVQSNTFYGLTLTIYHKADNSNWTSSIKTSTYGGATSVTWSTY